MSIIRGPLLWVFITWRGVSSAYVRLDGDACSGGDEDGDGNGDSFFDGTLLLE